MVIKNKINEKIKEYQQSTGATKTWISQRMNYRSPQALDKAIKNESNSLSTYAKFAEFLNCDVTELYEIISDDK